MNDTPPRCPTVQLNPARCHATPCLRLVVRDGARAVDFYQRALGAERLAGDEPGSGRRFEHAELALGGARLSVTQDPRAWDGVGPLPPGGSAVALELHVADAADRVEAMMARGATLVTPMQALARSSMARVRDPFGHLWVVRELLEAPVVDSRQGTPQGRPLSTPTRDDRNIGDAPAATQATKAGVGLERRAARVHLVIGPVGAGKSTFARQLVRDRSAMGLTLDDWMVTLFRPDRPATDVVAWYQERAERCIHQIWKIARQLTDRGDDVVLEIGLLRRDERERFYERVSEAGLPLTIYVLDAARDVRRARVLERNQRQGSTFSMVVPLEIFELASDLWQGLEPEECEGRDVRFSCTDPC